jgi:2,3-bisphosphoglycerate-independent phosphoglycerate mutase
MMKDLLTSSFGKEKNHRCIIILEMKRKKDNVKKTQPYYYSEKHRKTDTYDSFHIKPR